MTYILCQFDIFFESCNVGLFLQHHSSLVGQLIQALSKISVDQWRYYGGAKGGERPPPPNLPGEGGGGGEVRLAWSRGEHRRTPCYAHVIYALAS